MIGAIIGDIVGSVYEFENIDTKDFPLFSKDSTFTDDSVMTIAVAESLREYYLDDIGFRLGDLAVWVFHEIGRKYPGCGYGGQFYKWMMGDVWVPYNSCGNGSAMRISAVGDIAGTVKEAKKLSKQLTEITHNHPEGIKGAEACAVAKVLLKQGKSKEYVRKYIEDNYYKLDKTVDQYREENAGMHGREICQITVPQAFECFFEGKDFEDVIRNCISIGGDSDTIAAIAGGIAEACYEIPERMKLNARKNLTWHLNLIVDDWEDFVENLKKQRGTKNGK